MLYNVTSISGDKGYVGSEAMGEYRDKFGMMKSEDPALEAYENSNPLLKPKRKLTVSVVLPQTKKIFVGSVFPFITVIYTSLRLSCHSRVSVT
jgi:hypothetical protein